MSEALNIARHRIQAKDSAAMTDATDVALEKASIAACEAGHHAWPSTDGYNDRAEKRAFREIAKAAIEAYLAALPKGELAERLLDCANRLDRDPGNTCEFVAPPSHDEKEAADLLRAAASLLGGGVPTAEWEDPRVQVVYEILCSDLMPPHEEHWEGFAARRIVDALFPAARQEAR